MNYPTTTHILKRIKETEDTVTLIFKHNEPAKSGQFYMIWIPRVDEIPMSISINKNEYKGITFRIVGEATRALAKLDKNDTIGIRGPYGNGFNITQGKILFIGGGTGVATLASAVEEALTKGCKTTVILGFKTKREVFFEERLKEAGANVCVTTDDGSYEYQGYSTDYAAELLKKETYDLIITCGPELMMKKILELSDNVPLQASLERYMKCAIGLCGQCCIGKGLRVCREGPVFDGETLKTLEDFGIYRRDASGRKILFQTI
ncbi:MAG: dihydroorotate dehydrogenase electron transfer subunit [Candidatus Thermoplasmatota archaeon]